MEGIAMSNPVILKPKKKGRPKRKQLDDNLLIDNWDVQQMKDGEMNNILNVDSGKASDSQLFLEVEKDDVKLLEKREPKMIVSKILEISEAQDIEYGHTKDVTEPLQKTEPQMIVNEVKTIEDIKGFDAQSFTVDKEESTEQFMGQHHEVKQTVGDSKSVAVEAEATMTVDENNRLETPGKRGKQRKKQTVAKKDLSEAKDIFVSNNSSDILTSVRKKRVIQGKSSKEVKKMSSRRTDESNEETKGKVEKDRNGISADSLMFGKSEAVKKRKRSSTKGYDHEQISEETKTLKNEKDALDEEMQNFEEQIFVVKEDNSGSGMKKSKSDTSAKQSKKGKNVQKKRDSGWETENNEFVMSESVMEGLFSEKQKKKRKRSGGGDQKENVKASKSQLGKKRKIAIAESENITRKTTKSRNPKAQSKRLTTVAVSQKFVGAHVSMAGGIYNAIYNAANMGAKSFALFLKSSRSWQSKPLDDDDALKFREACKEHGYSSHLILPHGSYLMNCGSPHSETLEKSRDALIDELQRCEKLGLMLYNFHPGSTCGKGTVEDCLDRIAESINIAHSQTKYVITVIENMSCQGSTVGGKFTELAGIIARVKDKSRIGVCLDTCHAYAAGYDLSTEAGYKQMIAEFDRIIGFQYLKALHLNDSAGKLGSHLDRHENIGKGNIGKEGFRRVMNEPHFDNIPMILETPYTSDEIYSSEINLLESLCNK
ncbi:hypothetical protein CHS0354_028094 [Potamilus streckersoni]|uniref:Xylose isomerase-like TIM barrel domain-containing protein n=1 Tax=Potamilus streckersoni TaxID=2493646 RepID=A0AAE0THY0_9BIVA|nr:hypothetical protein CHS0354_028094 [Potamilus streckersoni]